MGILSIGEKVEEQDFVAEESAEWSPAFSPDGNWIAYTTDRDGQHQIYVRPYPRMNDDFWRVSTDFGEEPIWSPAGGELFYRSGNRIMAARYESLPDSGFNSHPPTEAVKGRFHNAGGLSYDVSKDGKRFLVLQPVFDDTHLPEIRIVRNWAEEVKQALPVKLAE